MIVVDAPIVAFLLIEGELTATARRLYKADPEWVTPPIINHELLNILGGLGHREGDATPMEVLWKEVRGLLAPRQQVPDPVRALRLSVEWGLSGYEAQYLALAETLALPLITEEERLLAVRGGRCVTPEEYLDDVGGRDPKDTPGISGPRFGDRLSVPERVRWEVVALAINNA